MAGQKFCVYFGKQIKFGPGEHWEGEPEHGVVCWQDMRTQVTGGQLSDSLLLEKLRQRYGA